jgi:hypothetical protein
MITALLLMPVAGVLVWLYWYLLPGRSWKFADTLLLGCTVLAMAGYIRLAGEVEFEGAGPMYPEIVAMVGAYGILIAGLCASLWWRRRG